MFCLTQKLGVVSEYLAMVDKAADGSGDGPNLVRVAEESEPKSMYGSCTSNSPKHSASSSSSTSDDGDDNDDDVDLADDDDDDISDSDGDIDNYLL